MKRFLTPILFLLITTLVVAQNHLIPVDFKSFTPAWDHMFVDSIRINEPNIDGTSHLKANPLILIDGEEMYFCFRDRISSDNGIFLQKINLSQPNVVVWTAVIDKSTYGANHYPHDIYLNSDNEIELILTRQLNDENLDVWEGAQLARCSFDKLDGSNISYDYDPSPDDEALYWLAFIIDGKSSVTYTRKNDDHYLFVQTYNDGDYGAIHRCKRFDTNMVLDSSFNITRNNKYSGKDTGPYLTYQNGMLVNHRNTYDIADSTNFDYWIDLFDLEMNLLDSVNIIPDNYYREKKGKNWKGGNNQILVTSHDDFVDYYSDSIAYHVLDINGNMDHYFDVTDENLVFDAELVSVPYSNEVILSYTKEEADSTISIVISKSNGINLPVENLILETNDKRLIRIEALNLTEDNTLLISYYIQWQFSPSSYKRVSGVFAVSAEALGLSSTRDLALAINEINIYPNPSKQLINVDLDVLNQGKYYISMYDINANLINRKSVILNEGLNSITQDVFSLPVGSYSIKIENEVGRIVSKVFVKI